MESATAPLDMTLVNLKVTQILKPYILYRSRVRLYVTINMINHQ